MPVHAVNTTPAYLFRKVADEAGPPTVLYDEIDTVFGPGPRTTRRFAGCSMLDIVGGCRRSVRRPGKGCPHRGTPGLCAVALAGLDDLPDTLMSRSVVVRMRRRAPDEVIEPFRHRLLRSGRTRDPRRSGRWASVIPIVAWPEMPAGIEDRDADIWEALLAAPDLAGGAWPERARCAAVTLVTATKAGSPSLGVRLLADLRTVFVNHGNPDYLFTDDIVSALVAMDDGALGRHPWQVARCPWSGTPAGQVRGQAAHRSDR